MMISENPPGSPTFPPLRVQNPEQLHRDTVREPPLLPNPRPPPITGNTCDAFSLYRCHYQTHPDDFHWDHLVPALPGLKEKETKKKKRNQKGQIRGVERAPSTYLAFTPRAKKESRSRLLRGQVSSGMYPSLVKKAVSMHCGVWQLLVCLTTSSPRFKSMTDRLGRVSRGYKNTWVLGICSTDVDSE
jgi:hypothetical protein